MRHSDSHEAFLASTGKNLSTKKPLWPLIGALLIFVSLVIVGAVYPLPPIAKNFTYVNYVLVVLLGYETWRTYESNRRQS